MPQELEEINKKIDEIIVEFNKKLSVLNFSLNLLIQKHNHLCDTIGESSFVLDIQQEIQNRKNQSEINNNTQAINKIRKNPD